MIKLPACTLNALVALLLFPAASFGQTAARSAADSARAVVDSFYRWYVPRSQKPGADMTWMLVTHQRSGLLSDDLVRALRADSIASSKSAGEVVGLDGDPILNAQDPCSSYRATRARQEGQSILVDVIGSGECAAHTAPDVVVEITRRGGRWTIVNFRYPGPPPDDLRSLLQQLAKDRRKP